MSPKKHPPADDSSGFWLELDALMRILLLSTISTYLFCSRLPFRLFFVKKNFRYYATLPRSQWVA